MPQLSRVFAVLSGLVGTAALLGLASPPAAAVDRASGPAMLAGPASVPEGGARLDPGLEPLRGDGTPTSWRSAAAPFPVRIAGTAIPFRVLAIQLLPGEDVTVEADIPDARLRYSAGSAQAGDVAGRWRWTAPEEPGVAAIRLESTDGQAVHLNVFVAYQADAVQDETLLGYPIGRYRPTPLRGDPAYLPPEGFVAVRAEDEDLLVSPHLRIGQFLCKQPGDPRLIHLSTPLVVKLEAVLEAVNEAGHPAATLHVMSGFRTPAYNRAIGNRTSYSRHLWGDAADIWVDHDGDGDMDDWNGDGRSDLHDAEILSRIVHRLEQERPELARPGGVGLYRRNAAHGPFVHVDARGHTARW